MDDVVHIHRQLGDAITKLTAEVTLLRRENESQKRRIFQLEQLVKVDSELRAGKRRTTDATTNKPAKRLHQQSLFEAPNLRYSLERGMSIATSPKRLVKSLNIPLYLEPTQYSLQEEEIRIEVLPTKTVISLLSSPLRSLPIKPLLKPGPLKGSPTKVMRIPSPEICEIEDDEVNDSQDEEPLLHLLKIPQSSSHTPLLAQKQRRDYLESQLGSTLAKLDLSQNPITAKPWVVSDFIPNNKFGASRKWTTSKKAPTVLRDRGMCRADFENRRLFYKEIDMDDGMGDYLLNALQIHDRVPLQPWTSTFPTTQEAAERNLEVDGQKKRRYVRRIKLCLDCHQNIQIGEFIFAEAVLNRYVQYDRVVVNYDQILG